MAERARTRAMTAPLGDIGPPSAPSSNALPPDPDWLGEVHADVQAVYRYWRTKCAGRQMPSRADIDPADLIAYLPSVMLVDVRPSPPVYVYRLVGTREVSMRGVDPTGQPVATHSFGLEAAAALSNYDEVVARRAPWIDRAEMLSADGRMLDRDKLFLPLSANGHDVDMILVYSVQEQLP
jgi:hypothetical protein